jgi:hypothetical protein
MWSNAIVAEVAEAVVPGPKSEVASMSELKQVLMVGLESSCVRKALHPGVDVEGTLEAAD